MNEINQFIEAQNLKQFFFYSNSNKKLYKKKLYKMKKENIDFICLYKLDCKILKYIFLNKK